MGRAAQEQGTAGPQEQALGRLLFERYPHLVPSPMRVSSLASLVCGLEEQSQGGFRNVRPMKVLEAWFDCWATLAFREPHPAGCDCTTRV